MKHFRSSIIFTVIGIILGGLVGHYYGGTEEAIIKAIFTVLILGVLEISISFDNAVVNAHVLKDMTPLWQHRFLTWGMWIAVFGMRLVFPLLIVAIVAKLNPFEALEMAALNPADYAKIMLSVHHEVAAFGGSFLALVALKYFFNYEKKHHWISFIEKPLAKMGKLSAVEVGVVIVSLMVISKYVPADHAMPVVFAGLAGILTFLAVEGVGAFLEVPETHVKDVHRASLGMFLYLEVLDASFSFDGVVGAFAITNNLFIIAIGLGIGAFFVRSLTILMVEKGTLNAFEFLEHGAFYAVASLGAIMLINTFYDIPEIVTGLMGATIIGISVLSSMRAKKKRSKRRA